MTILDNSLEMEIKFSSFTLRLINFIKSPITWLRDDIPFSTKTSFKTKKAYPKKGIHTRIFCGTTRPQIAISGINLLSSYAFRFSCEIEIFYVNAIAIILRSNGRGQGRENIAGKLQPVPRQ